MPTFRSLFVVLASACLLLLAKTCGPSTCLDGDRMANTWFVVLSLNWEGYHFTLWHHKGLLSRAVCFNLLFHKKKSGTKSKYTYWQAKTNVFHERCWSEFCITRNLECWCLYLTSVFWPCQTSPSELPSPPPWLLLDWVRRRSLWLRW